MECEIEVKEVATSPEILVLFEFFIKILSKVDCEAYGESSFLLSLARFGELKRLSSSTFIQT